MSKDEKQPATDAQTGQPAVPVAKPATFEERRRILGTEFVALVAKVTSLLSSTDTQQSRHRRGKSAAVAATEAGAAKPGEEATAGGDDLNGQMHAFKLLARQLLLRVYNMAARPSSPLVIHKKDDKYGGTVSIVPVKEDASVDTSTIETSLKALETVGLSSPDMVKEVNNLLAHTNVKRMAEEMDTNAYLAGATRLYDRVRSEFLETSEALDKESKEEVSADLAQVSAFLGVAVGWRRRPELSASNDLREAIKLLDVAGNFLADYQDVMDKFETPVRNVLDYFRAESSVEAYRDVTRDHARRLEDQGVFAARWPVVMAAFAVFFTAVFVLFFQHNAIFKNWALQTILFAGVAMYLWSVYFGVKFRANHMNDVRDWLLAKVVDILDPLGNPKSIVTKRRVRRDGWIAKIFRFIFRREKSEWFINGGSHFSVGTMPWPKPQSEPSSVAVQQDVAAGAFLPKSATPSKEAQAAAVEIEGARRFIHAFVRDPLGETSESQEKKHRRWMEWKNYATLAAILLLPFGASWLMSRFANQDTYTFVAQTPDHGACTLGTGHMLLGTADSYFAVIDGETREIARSSVLLMRPGDNPNKLSACDDKRRDPGPSFVNLVGMPDLTPDQTGMLAAAGNIADKIETGLKAVADSGGGGCVANCGSPAQLPIIIPLIVEVEAATPAPDFASEGTNFITQIHVADRLVLDRNRMVMLPLFQRPVDSNADKPTFAFGGEGINTRKEAYFFGLKSMLNPNMPGAAPSETVVDGVTQVDVETLVGKIGESIGACAVRTKNAYDSAGKAPPQLKLLIEGFASDKWEAEIKPGQEDPGVTYEQLNHHLAEGRRHAVLQALKAGIAQAEKSVEPITLVSDLIDVGENLKSYVVQGPGDVDLDQVGKGFLFDDFKEMQEARELALKGADAKLDLEASPAERELFARSVLISVPDDYLENCGKVR